MKKWLGFFGALLFSGVAVAQTTIVVGVATDSDSTLWTNGTVSAQFVPNPSQPNLNVYRINGAPLSIAVIMQGPISLGSGGNFSVTVYDNTQITPSGSQWQFTVCPNAISKCGSVTTSVSGSGQSITTLIDAAIPAPRFPAVAGSYGYVDVEGILSTPVGGTYWNVVSSCQRYYNGSSWSCGNPPTGCIVGGTIPISCGGTGATTAAGALANLGALPLAGGTMNGPLKAPSINGTIYLNLESIDGMGTSTNPWTGWESILNNATSGTHYHFSAGYYLQAAQITLGANGANNISITGDGTALVTITAAGGSSPPAYMFTSDGVNARNFDFGGMTLNGNGTSIPVNFLNDSFPYGNIHDLEVSGSSGYGIQIQGCQGCTVERLVTQNNSYGAGIIFNGDNATNVSSLWSQFNSGNGIEVHACEFLDWGTTQTNCVPVMQLSAAVTSTGTTTFSVNDASYANVNQIYRVGQVAGGELVKVTGVTNTPNGYGQAVWTLTVIRGWNSTTAATALIGTVLEAVNSSTFTNNLFDGGVNFAGVTVSESNSQHAIWVNSIAPTTFEHVWIEQVPNYFDGLRFTGPDSVVKAARMDGTATVANANAAVHLLPGSSGTRATGIFWANDNSGGYFAQYVADSSVTSGEIDGISYSNSTNYIQGLTFLSRGTASYPVINIGGCGIYILSEQIAFTCPPVISVPSYPVSSWTGYSVDGQYDTGLYFGTGNDPFRVSIGSTGLSRSGGTTTAVTATHGFVNGDYVYQANTTSVGGTNFTGYFGPITVVNSTTYYYADAQANDTGGNGTTQEASRVVLTSNGTPNFSCNLGICSFTSGASTGYNATVRVAIGSEDLTTGLAHPALGAMDLYGGGTLAAHIAATGSLFHGNADTATTAGTAGTLITALSANQLLGSLTAVAPTGQSVPSCSTAASALQWTSGTGFACNTSITAGATPLPTPGSSISLSAPRGYAVCTTTCTVTLPTPAAGYEFCAVNDDNVSTVITIAAISGVYFEKTARTGYETVNTAMTSGGAVGDKICMIGRDATHYLTLSYNGTWML